ncbi:MAG: glycosyltransferase [bacterium]
MTPSFQHPLVRGPHRHYHFIRELSKRHDITLLTLSRANITPEAMSEMQSYTDNIITFDVNGASQVGRTASQIPLIGSHVKESLKLRDGVDKMKKAFLELVNKNSYDLVLFHGKSLFPVIEDWNELPIVADFCDATSMRIRSRMQHVALLKRSLLFFRYMKLRNIEKKLIKKTPHVAFISHRDRKAVTGVNGESTILPIGVDFEFWQRRTEDYRPNCVIFTGVMDYGPNHDAAMRLIENILPRLRKRVSDPGILIVGRNPRPELKRTAEKNPEVTVTGFVDDMRLYLEKAAVFAAPLLWGSGIQNKVLESMAMAVPVVTNNMVAEGLYIDSYGAPPVYQAESDEDFAAGLAHILKNRQERTRLAMESRAFVENHFNWSQSARILESMCEKAVHAAVEV